MRETRAVLLAVVLVSCVAGAAVASDRSDAGGRHVSGVPSKTEAGAVSSSPGSPIVVFPTIARNQQRPIMRTQGCDAGTPGCNIDPDPGGGSGGDTCRCQRKCISGNATCSLSVGTTDGCKPALGNVCASCVGPNNCGG